NEIKIQDEIKYSSENDFSYHSKWLKKLLDLNIKIKDKGVELNKVETYFKYLMVHKDNIERKSKEMQSYWLLMNGHKFEKEIGKLFMQLNQEMKVNVTSGSDDGGIDIIINFRDQFIPVQCKNHARPVSPNAIRDFQGAI